MLEHLKKFFLSLDRLVYIFISFTFFSSCCGRQPKPPDEAVVGIAI